MSKHLRDTFAAKEAEVRTPRPSSPPISPPPPSPPARPLADRCSLPTLRPASLPPARHPHTRHPATTELARLCHVPHGGLPLRRCHRPPHARHGAWRRRHHRARRALHRPSGRRQGHPGLQQRAFDRPLPPLPGRRCSSRTCPNIQVALAQGVDYNRCLQFVREAREQGLKTPVILMGPPPPSPSNALSASKLTPLAPSRTGYFNPLLAHGEERAVQDAKEAGANGFIIVDLPPEEAVEFRKICTREGCVPRGALSPSNRDRRADMQDRAACRTSR